MSSGGSRKPPPPAAAHPNGFPQHKDQVRSVGPASALPPFQGCRLPEHKDQVRPAACTSRPTEARRAEDAVEDDSPMFASAYFADDDDDDSVMVRPAVVAVMATAVVAPSISHNSNSGVFVTCKFRKNTLYVMAAVVLVGVVVVAGVCGSGNCSPIAPRSSSQLPAKEVVVAPPTKNPTPSIPSPTPSPKVTLAPVTQEFVVVWEGRSMPTALPTFMPTSTPTPSPQNQEESLPASGSLYFNVGALNQVYQDEQKREWQPIPAPEGSSTFSTCGEDTVFENTKDEELYCSEIWMQSPAALDFSIRVPSGNYQVVLHFTEAYAQGPGERVMDIPLQNDLIGEDFDIYTTAGGEFRATQWFGSPAVTDSDLIITLSPKIGNPTLSAIEVAAV